MASEVSATRERTRRAILAAAIPTLVGKPTASLGEVADAAGVARSTLHRYFPDRAALVAALNGHVEAEYAAAIERSRPDEGTGLEAYRRICDEMFAVDAFAWWLQHTEPQATDDSADGDGSCDDSSGTQVDDRLADVVRRGHDDGTIDASLDPDWLVNHIWAVLYAAWHLQGPRRSRQQVREIAMTTLTKAAAA